jgi:hypothetical protein
MKTATIHIYNPFGTSELVGDVLYRGRVLASFDRSSPWVYDMDGLTSTRVAISLACRRYSELNMFTHYKHIANPVFVCNSDFPTSETQIS